MHLTGERAQWRCITVLWVIVAATIGSCVARDHAAVERDRKLWQRIKDLEARPPERVIEWRPYTPKEGAADEQRYPKSRHD